MINTGNLISNSKLYETFVKVLNFDKGFFVFDLIEELNIKFVIPRNEESPLETLQRLAIFVAELLTKIPRSSE